LGINKNEEIDDKVEKEEEDFLEDSYQIEEDEGVDKLMIRKYQ
jgi:hypothetical protein